MIQTEENPEALEHHGPREPKRKPQDWREHEEAKDIAVERKDPTWRNLGLSHSGGGKHCHTLSSSHFIPALESPILLSTVDVSMVFVSYFI